MNIAFKNSGSKDCFEVNTCKLKSDNLIPITLDDFEGCANSKPNEDNRVIIHGKVDKNNATKNGFYFKGFLINISYDELLELDGKTIEIGGLYELRKGLNKTNPDQIEQGHEDDIKYIADPIYHVFD